MRTVIALLVILLPAAAAEKAAYDSTGRIIALITEAEDLEISTGLVAVQPTGKRVPLAGRGPGAGARRERDRLAWSGPFELPDGGRGTYQLRSEEDPEGVRYTATVKAETPLTVDAIEFVIDLPRAVFVNGALAPRGGAEVKIPAVRGADPALYRGETDALRLISGSGNRWLDLAFGAPRRVVLFDRWDPRGRSYQLRVAFERSETATLATSLKAGAKPETPAPAMLKVDVSKPRGLFDGFGGNYCWNNESPAALYTVQNLKLAWARTEMKADRWDKERDNPGRAILADMAMMKRFQEMGVPYVISIWWLPERLYTDPYEKPRSAHMRKIDPAKWAETLDLVSSYLLYAKREHGVEPDLFSFNEANIGVYVGLTPEEHTEALKRFGAHFKKLGLKTRMLLGDATGPRDTHNYVLHAAADAEAMQYVGAVGFHSWGGATPAQYAAWGDVGEWLGLPLLVTELGVDAAAYRARSWDSYHYGLREARMTQEILTYARPRGTQFWQFTNDYALVRTRPDGTVEPSARFWLMKQFTDLTPQKSEMLAVSSDQPSVLFTAFRKGGEHALHILNLGGARQAQIEGLPEAEWQAVRTTETEHYQASGAGRSVKGALAVALPARSLTTLTAR